VYALAVFDDGSGPALYAGGRFGDAPGTPQGHIGRWDGSSWSPLGTGVRTLISSPSVNALAVWDDGDGPALYVGGEFNRAGDVVARRIARWDGNTWSALGGGFRPNIGGANATVHSIVLWNDELYVGGDMSYADTNTDVNGVARWTGSSWSSLGSGMNVSPLTGQVIRALATFDDGSGSALYAAGSFSVAGGVGARNIARWDGSSWSPLGEGFEYGVGGIYGFEDHDKTSLIVGPDIVGPHVMAHWVCQKLPRPKR
jgi:hypothetical protein